MPYQRYNTKGFHTMRATAKALGISETHFWWLVKCGVLPQPLNAIGKRCFYSDYDLQNITNIMQARNEQGQ